MTTTSGQPAAPFTPSPARLRPRAGLRPASESVVSQLVGCVHRLSWHADGFNTFVV